MAQKIQLNVDPVDKTTGTLANVSTRPFGQGLSKSARKRRNRRNRRSQGNWVNVETKTNPPMVRIVGPTFSGQPMTNKNIKTLVKNEVKKEEAKIESKHQLEHLTQLATNLPCVDSLTERLHKHASIILHNLFDWSAPLHRGYTTGTEDTALAEYTAAIPITVPAGTYFTFAIMPECTYAGNTIYYSTGATVFQDPKLTTSGAIASVYKTPYYNSSFMETDTGFRVARCIIRFRQIGPLLNQGGLFKAAYIPSLSADQSGATWAGNVSFNDPWLENQGLKQDFTGDSDIQLNWIPKEEEGNIGYKGSNSGFVGYATSSSQLQFMLTIKIGIEFAPTTLALPFVNLGFPSLDESAKWYFTTFLSQHRNLVVSTVEDVEKVVMQGNPYMGNYLSRKAYVRSIPVVPANLEHKTDMKKLIHDALSGVSTIQTGITRGLGDKVDTNVKLEDKAESVAFKDIQSSYLGLKEAYNSLKSGKINVDEFNRIYKGVLQHVSNSNINRWIAEDFRLDL